MSHFLFLEPGPSNVCWRYVGNTMATFVMQTLGCEVAAINTVQFS
jgi:pyridoxine kinase